MAGFELKVWQLVCYSIIFVIGLIGNVIICIVVWKNGPWCRYIPFNLYLMALAITDLAVAVLCLPIYVMSTSKFVHPEGAGGIAFCKIVTGYFVPFWLGGASIYILVVMSFERVTAVRKPLVANNLVASRRTYTNIASAWLIGLVMHLVTIINVTHTKSDPSIGNHCTFSSMDSTGRRSIFTFTFILQYVIPALIFIINYYRGQKCLKALECRMKQYFNEGRKQVLAKKKRSNRIVFALSVAFFVCWIPNSVMNFLLQNGGVKELSWNSDLYQAGLLLGFFKSCFSPFLYASISREFRRSSKKVFKKIFGMKGADRNRGQGERPRWVMFNVWKTQ